MRRQMASLGVAEAFFGLRVSVQSFPRHGGAVEGLASGNERDTINNTASVTGDMRRSNPARGVRVVSRRQVESAGCC